MVCLTKWRRTDSDVVEAVREDLLNNGGVEVSWAQKPEIFTKINKRRNMEVNTRVQQA